MKFAENVLNSLAIQDADELVSSSEQIWRYFIDSGVKC